MTADGKYLSCHFRACSLNQHIDHTPNNTRRTHRTRTRMACNRRTEPIASISTND